MVSRGEHGKWSNAREDIVQLVSYDPQWAERFADEERAIRSVLDPAIRVDIEHFGSTAIPGLVAKPIIDIMMGVTRQSWLQVIASLKQLNYVHWEENPDPDREFLVKGMPPFGTGRTHHVHICETHSPFWERLWFRDYLRVHPEARLAYAQLKEKLASEHREDREAYTEGKDRLVSEIMEKARAWRGSG